jgi:hypothetical protein
MPVGNHTLPSQLLRTCDDGTLSCLSQWAFNVTQGMFWVFALFSFCIALFMATARFGNKRAFGYASVVGLIGSVWFGVQGLMIWEFVSAFILTGIVGIVIMIMDERK